ncbi:MerR family transcriptional regulator [Priestia koreensis]|uniref:MerR family transcriptional regulator n=1 Tax=Priestia koreensis TaxID=284581 RepID=UPI002041D1FE|nr:MerR family transcriptional regulator [Priestia koreensis]
METSFENKETLFTPKQVSKITGVESTLLLKWVNYFNIETQWTQEDQQGHRRYTKQNIEEILQLKHLIQEKKLNWDQAKTFFEGNEPEFIVDEGKTRIETKVEQILENQESQKDFIKNQEKFNQSLIEQLNAMTRLYQDTLNELAATKQEVISFKEEQKLLSSPSNDEWITRRRIEHILRSEARELWSQKPAEERMIKTGFLRKEEDKIKRDDFIQDYIDSKLAERFEEEMKRA